MAKADPRLYPSFTVENNKKPNRILNFPIFGFLIKIIILIPVFIEGFFLGVAGIFLLVINWFVISFTGRYWNTAYTFFVGLIRLFLKIKLFLFGITDTYPGFRLNDKGIFSLTIDKPKNPNKWFAIPILGILARVILLLPYLIFSDIMQRGSGIAWFLSWFVILFKGRLPERFYEFERDSLRVYTAATMYVLGLSDDYPSFYISMDHQTTKLLLIIVGTILSLFNTLGSLAPSEKSSYNSSNYHQYYTPPSGGSSNYNTY